MGKGVQRGAHELYRVAQIPGTQGSVRDTIRIRVRLVFNMMMKEETLTRGPDWQRDREGRERKLMPVRFALVGLQALKQGNH
jgi:hypothetical protein